jgi:sugar phosphate isomerase/epimerase
MKDAQQPCLFGLCHSNIGADPSTIMNRISRRNFIGTAAAAAAGLTLPQRAFAEAKPNSVFSGVRIGTITYSYRSMAKTAEETLKALLEDGISETELMGGPIQDFTGIKGPATDAEREQQLAKCRELRKLYNDAGVNIHIHKMGFGQSDEEIEFSFLVAKELGCTGVTTERNAILAARLAPFADKHKIWVGFHNHTKNLPEMDKHDAILDLGEYIGFNLDIGHYVAGSGGKSPIPVLEKYHKRIVNLHLKDRTADGGNVPWGQGQTPIKEVLQLMKKEKWTFPAEVELEYPIPADSNAIAEVKKCVQYCREALA